LTADHAIEPLNLFWQQNKGKDTNKSGLGAGLFDSVSF